jgi:hypothetical protein
MGNRYIVEPAIENGGVTVGTEGNETRVFIGELAETGGSRRVYFDASKEFVTLIIGKRGSGKSHTLGALLEGLCTTLDETSISHITKRRGVLLLDPMGNFWTTILELRGNGPPRMREQFTRLEEWGLHPESVEVRVWIPAGCRLPISHPCIEEFHVHVGDLDVHDWGDLLGVDTMRDPQGILLAEGFDAVCHAGWRGQDGVWHAANANYVLDDLITYFENERERETEGESEHHATSLRALLRDLRGLAREPVFQGMGTPLTNLVQTGVLSILLLPSRVGHDRRRVITRLLARRILKEREIASEIQNRLDFEGEMLGQEEKVSLVNALEHCIPRTVLAIDEAQELLGEEGGEARQALEDYCLRGRGIGLSLVLATQTPSVSAISAKVRKQVDTCFIHQLLTREEIAITESNLQAPMPEKVVLRQRACGYDSLIRSLETGQCVVASARTSTARDGQGRAFVMNVRPRVRVHGGEVS